ALTASIAANEGQRSQLIRPDLRTDDRGGLPDKPGDLRLDGGGAPQGETPLHHPDTLPAPAAASRTLSNRSAWYSGRNCSSKLRRAFRPIWLRRLGSPSSRSIATASAAGSLGGTQ